MEEAEDDLIVKGGNVLRDYGTTGIGLLSLGALTFASDPKCTWLAGGGLLFAGLATFLQERRNGSYSELRRQAAAGADLPRVTAEVVGDFVKGYLVNLGDERLDFDEEPVPTRRLTLYSRASDTTLKQIARYTRQSSWSHGRDLIPMAGIAAQAWNDGRAFASISHDPETAKVSYKNAQIALGLSADQADGLSMKPRLYYAVRVQEKFAEQPMAVLVFESTDPKAYEEAQLREILNDTKATQYRTQIVKLVHQHFPDLAEAESMGF